MSTLAYRIQEADSKKLPILLLTFCQEIAAGMAYFSGKQFIHKDLTASNILVSGKHICKVQYYTTDATVFYRSRMIWLST